MRGLLTIAATLLAARTASAFCGFYVAGGDQKMFNDATQVVLMHQGTRTVLAMQNTYKGPPENFAMVIPVPVILKETDVKTLPNEVFAHVEQMGAPRLVEYWEKDPCRTEPDYEDMPRGMAMDPRKEMANKDSDDKNGVTVEAKFTVGEYNILILSAKDSTGLETWLKAEKYTIPDGAEPLLRPYVESGMKWFVAKVDVTKVKFVDNRVALSPLRFHYDSDDFTLPIRLGLANSSGTQDLIVNILAPNQRYEVTNYKNVTIPTNIDVRPDYKDKFAAFYTALYDRTVEKNPGAVITEYAWQATTCDPCPGPALDQSDFMTLGADVLGGTKDQPGVYANADFVLTRLHARYGKSITDDLRFKEAKPLVGGREFLQSNGKLEEGAKESTTNNFQGRYAIRHEWTGPVSCANPIRKRWGGPPGNEPNSGTQAALGLAFTPRGAVALPAAVLQNIPEIDVKAGASEDKPPVPVGSGSAAPTVVPPTSPTTPIVPETKKKSGCGCSAERNDLGGGALLIGAVLLGLRRRRTR